MGDDLGSGPGPLAPVETMLRDAFERARSLHGEMGLDPSAFEAALRARARRRLERSGIEPTVAAIDDALRRLATEDVYLAVACDLGREDAWARFVTEYVPRLARFLRCQGLEDADAVAAEIPGLLVIPSDSPGARTRIGTYDGSGALFTWAGTVALRHVAARGRGPRLATLDSAAVEERSARGWSGARDGRSDSPLDEVVAEEAGSRMEECLRRSWARLTPREALALGWKFGEGLSQVEIARLLDVGEPRVSRLLRQGLDKLGDDVLRDFPRDSGPAQGPAWSAIARAVTRHLQRVRMGQSASAGSESLGD